MNARLLRIGQYLLTVIFGQALSFLLLPIVTRYLDPPEYGQYALALAVSGFVGMFASSWVRNVGLRLYYDASARGTTRGFYLGTALLQAVTASGFYLLVLLIMWVTGLELANLTLMVVAGLVLVIGDQYVYAVTLIRAEECSTSFTVAEVSSGVLRFGATLVGLWIGFLRAEMLFLAMGIAYLSGVLYAIPALWKRLQGPARVDRAGVLETIRHGPAALPSSVAHWLDSLANRLILQGALGTAVVGIFTVGYSIGERLVATLTQAVFMMAWPNVLTAWRDGGVGSARVAVNEAQRLYAFVTVGPVAFLIVFSAEITRILVGPQYHDAGAIVPLIASTIWFQSLSTYLNRHLELEKRFGRLSAIALSGAALNVGLSLFLVGDYGMVGVATASVFSSAGTCAFYYLTRDTRVTAVSYGSFAAALGLAAVAWATSRLVAGLIDLGDAPSGYLGMATFIMVYLVGLVAAFFAYRVRTREQNEPVWDSGSAEAGPPLPSPGAYGEDER